MPSSGLILDPLNQSGASGSIYDRFGNVGALNDVACQRIESGIWGLKYNGATSYMDFGTGLYQSITNNFSLLFWVKPLGLPTGSSDKCVLEITGLTDLSFWMDNANLTFTVYKYLSIAPGYELKILNLSSAMPFGQWSHIGITKDGATLTGYLNGESFDSETYAEATIVPASGKLVFGARANYSSPLGAWTNPPKLFNLPLSAGEIMGYHNATKGYYQ